MKVYTLKELKESGISKRELTKDIKFTFDYAVPQPWLDDFSEWCKLNHPELNYHTILFSVVWGYPEKLRFCGLPIFFCKEVLNAHREYQGRIK